MHDDYHNLRTPLLALLKFVSNRQIHHTPHLSLTHTHQSAIKLHHALKLVHRHGDFRHYSPILLSFLS